MLQLEWLGWTSGYRAQEWLRLTVKLECHMAQAWFKECTPRPELSLMERTCALWHVLIFAAIAESCTNSHFHLWNLANSMSIFYCLFIKDRTILDTLGMMLQCYSICMYMLKFDWLDLWQSLVFVTRRGAVLLCGGPTHRPPKEKHGYGILARLGGVKVTSVVSDFARSCVPYSCSYIILSWTVGLENWNRLVWLVMNLVSKHIKKETTSRDQVKWGTSSQG